MYVGPGRERSGQAELLRYQATMSATHLQVWRGVVWCGVVWSGAMWCDVDWCGEVWCGVVHFLVWCNLVQCVDNVVRFAAHRVHPKTLMKCKNSTI